MTRYYNVTDKDVDDGLVFAQVSVPISDWWGGAHALKKARIREQQAENDRLQAREMLAVEIERTWSEVQESYAQILLTRRSVTSAAENLRQNRNFYQAGTAPLTDLLDAETVYQGRILPFGSSHGIDNRFNSFKGIVVDIDIFQCFTDTGNHGSQIFDISHLFDLLDLTQEIIKIKLIAGNFLL